MNKRTLLLLTGTICVLSVSVLALVIHRLRLGASVESISSFHEQAGGESAKTPGRSIGIVLSSPIPGETRQAEKFEAQESSGLFVGVRYFYDGEGHPSESIAEVPFAVDDAVDLAHLFVFELNLLPSNRTVLALSGDPQKPESRLRLKALLRSGAVRCDARFTTLLNQITKAKSSAGDRGLLIVTIASHGFTKNDDDRLLAEDSSLKDLELTGLPVRRVLEDVASSRSPRRMVFLDACRERLEPSRGLGDPSTAMSRSFYSALTSAKGMVVLGGTTAGGFSYDDPRAMNGVFTAKILAGLRGQAPTDERGFVTPQTLADYVDGEVKSWIEVNRPEQTRHNVGIAVRFDDMRIAQMPLAMDPQAVSEANDMAARREHLLDVLRLRMDFNHITGAMVDEISSRLKTCESQSAAPLIERLERLEREGSDYCEDFALWWGQRGRLEVRPAPTTVAMNTHHAASLILASFITRGQWTHPDAIREAQGVLLRESAAGNPVANSVLGLAYAFVELPDGFLFPTLPSRGRALIESSRSGLMAQAAGGDPVACLIAGIINHDDIRGSIGIEGSDRECVDWLEKAANLGDGLSMVMLSAGYQRSAEGFTKDLVMSNMWYDRALEVLRNSLDQEEIDTGLVLFEALSEGEFRESRAKEAQLVPGIVDAYIARAENGDPRAYTTAAMLLLNLKKEDRLQAEEWLKKGAEGGDYCAMVILGHISSEASARSTWERQSLAALESKSSKGDVWAAKVLGAIQLNRGEIQDAVRWFEKAQESGDIYAMQKLADIYSRKGSSSEDISKAKALLGKLVEMGDTTPGPAPGRQWVGAEERLKRLETQDQ